ncbi:exocyst complex component EXO70B1-like [Vicia villosa]|uniref:exocyst complex component EXO70B1-like n=1 Tax=Vicia villosa TaxID=3911 RepID=UPI00273AAA1D|nr:exocyst complex component EXO70B1-like [Vicia villosa]
MSLSLSRRKTQCGFEIDLLYFFLGCLLAQLMKIKLLLFTVGACFSYLLIILRSCFSSMDAIANSLQDENGVVVIEVHSNSPQHASTNSNTNTMVEEFSNHMKLLQKENSNHVDMLLKQLKEYRISDPNFEGLFRPKENLNPMIDALPPETIDNLHKTAKLMVNAGFEKEFSDLYFSCRRECLVENLSRLGFKKLSIEDVQMLSWKEIEDEIVKWINVCNVALKILFPRERRLGDRVFFGFSSSVDLSFINVCKESTLQLLNFADAIAIGSRSPERLFRVLDMYETMRDLFPMFEFLFRDQYNGSLQKEATTTWKRLGEAIRGIFTELANLISQDPAKAAAVPGGGLHPITRFVMNYLHFASQSRHTLEQVFEEDYEHPLKEYHKMEDRVHSTSSLSVQIRLIIDRLESNLEAKSKIYEDPALYYVFLMNNSWYIVEKAQDSELGAILGDDWIKKHTAKTHNKS